jgi:hypothetical protein
VKSITRDAGWSLVTFGGCTYDAIGGESRGGYDCCPLASAL